MVLRMVFDSLTFDLLTLVGALALFAASVAAWRLAAPLAATPRLYTRFAAMLFAALAVSAPLGLADVTALFLLPLSSVSLMIGALARVATPLPGFAASLALVLSLAAGLGGLLTGYGLLALAPAVLASLAIIAAALQGMALMPALAGTALLACGLAFLEQGAKAGLFLLCAAALMGVTRSRSSQKDQLLRSSSRALRGERALP